MTQSVGGQVSNERVVESAAEWVIDRGGVGDSRLESVHPPALRPRSAPVPQSTIPCSPERVHLRLAIVHPSLRNRLSQWYPWVISDVIMPMVPIQSSLPAELSAN